jgi:hypothetical protein
LRSISRILPSSVVTSKVWVSFVGTIDVIGSVDDKKDRLHYEVSVLTAQVVGSELSFPEVVRSDVTIDRSTDYFV